MAALAPVLAAAEGSRSQRRCRCHSRVSLSLYACMEVGACIQQQLGELQLPALRRFGGLVLFVAARYHSTCMEIVGREEVDPGG